MMEEALRRDRTRSTIHSFSALGLLEFTRKRVGKDLGVVCKNCAAPARRVPGVGECHVCLNLLPSRPFAAFAPSA